MGLFGRRREAPVRPALGRAGVRFVAGEWPAGYEAQLRDGFAGNAVAQRAVRLVAEGCAAAPVYAEAGGEAAERAVALIVPPLVEAAATHLLLHGNAFLQPGLGADGEPAALYALRPERVSVEPDAAGWPAAWRYRAGDAVARILASDGAGRPGLIHVRSVHPGDDHCPSRGRP